MLTRQRVFITGLGIVSPVGLTARETWENLVRGISGVGPITLFDVKGKTDFATRIAAEVKGFDPQKYMSAKEVRRTDRFTWFAFAAANEALGQAKLNVRDVNPYRFAVLVSSSIGGITTLSEQYDCLREKGPRGVSPFLLPKFLSDMASGYLCEKIGAKGPNYCLVSSCSSGADAIGDVIRMIRNDEVDVAIAGGSEAGICPIGVAGFNAMRALSTRNDEPEKASRPFDRERNGFVMGEGAAILVVESEESVTRRKAQPLAELRGYAATSDAHHPTAPEETAESAAMAMTLAIERAGIRPEHIDYINAHGTSTLLNDEHETRALKRALGDAAYGIPISSTKSMTGHLLGAGGALEIAICVLAMQKGVIPPTINLENPDEACDLDYTPKIARLKTINVTMSISFGFGGHNSAVVLSKPE